MVGDSFGVPANVSSAFVVVGVTEIDVFVDKSVVGTTLMTGDSDGVPANVSNACVGAGAVILMFTMGCAKARGTTPMVLVPPFPKAISPALIALSDWICGSGMNLLI